MKPIVLSIALFFCSTCLLLAQPKVGQEAPNINLPNVDGQNVGLNNFKGKVVLLDFWASWCGPCRQKNPSLVKLYSKLKDKGFEIYSVSIDGNEKKWKAAIKKDKIKWTQVISPGDWQAPIVSQWNLEAIPTTYLLDKNGKVVAIDLEGKELETKIKSLLGVE